MQSYTKTHTHHTWQRTSWAAMEARGSQPSITASASITHTAFLSEELGLSSLQENFLQEMAF